ncbi:MAG: sigma-70 family RNA polymerase sigma factor [Thermomicrobiales bacterium]
MTPPWQSEPGTTVPRSPCSTIAHHRRPYLLLSPARQPAGRRGRHQRDLHEGVGGTPPLRSPLRTGIVSGWLFTIAHHVAMDALRRRPMRPLAPDWEMADPAALPDDRVVADEAAQELHAALATLTDDQRTILHLRLAGLSAPEIAQVLGRTPQAIKSTQFRAITQLRKQLHAPSPPSSTTAATPTAPIRRDAGHA